MSGLFRYAAGSAALVVVLLAAFLIPGTSWDAATIAAVASLAASVALSLSIPKTFTGRGKSDAGRIATIGLSSVVLGGYFILSVGTLAIAALGIDRKFVWAALTVSVGWLVIGSLISRGSVQYIDTVSAEKTQDAPTRSMIMAELTAISFSCPEQFTADINRLLETMRYSASDLSGSPSTENATILSLVNDNLRLSCRDGDASLFRKAVLDIDEKISIRDARLKTARSKI